MRIQQKKRADTVQECDKRKLSLSSADIVSKTALTSVKMWLFMSGSKQRAEEKKQIFRSVNRLNSPEAAGPELKDSCGSISAQKTFDQQLLQHREEES